MNTTDTRMFFILGRGRSGSDLLVRMLNTHQYLSVAPESLFLINLYRKYANVKNWDRQKILSFFHDLLLENRLTDWWQLDKKQLKHDLLKLSERATFQTLCKTVYLNFAYQAGKENVKLLGDKNPTYTLFAKELLQIYPEAKFIHLVRDPRDNILSFRRVGFDLNNISALAYRWKGYNDSVLQISKQHPDKFLLVKFEDMLFNSTSALKRICSFIGVDYDEKMLGFYKDTRVLNKWQKNLNMPIGKDRAFLWKKKMRKKNIQKADYVCKKTSENLGYEIMYKNSPWDIKIATLYGFFLGRLMNCLEKMIFYIPIRLRIPILNFYRGLTKTDTKLN